MKRKSIISIILAVSFVLALIAAGYGFVASAERAGNRYAEAELENLERALRRAAAACYAAEGAYPPDISYLCEHYGVQVNENKYKVFYDAFAENLMPDITVVELSE